MTSLNVKKNALSIDDELVEIMQKKTKIDFVPLGIRMAKSLVRHFLKFRLFFW